jgi:acyl-CoA hydrolase
MKENLISSVARLKDIDLPEKEIENIYDAYYYKRSSDEYHIDRDNIARILNHLPTMLSILEQIRPGDTKILQRMITIFNQSAWQGEYQAEVDCLKRYQAMAAKMEAESHEG